MVLEATVAAGAVVWSLWQAPVGESQKILDFGILEKDSIIIYTQLFSF